MSIVTITPSVTLPLSLQEVKDHLRLDDSAHDSLLLSLIGSATNHTEMFTRLKWINATFDWSFYGFPSGRVIRLDEQPLAPLVSVTSIKYVDTDGATQTLATSEYVVDIGVKPGEIELAFDKSWPSTRGQRNAVTVRMIVGHGEGPGDVPEDAKAVMKLLIGTWYDNREGVIVGTISSKLPDAVESLLWGLRILEA